MKVNNPAVVDPCIIYSDEVLIAGHLSILFFPSHSANILTNILVPVNKHKYSTVFNPDNHKF